MRLISSNEPQPKGNLLRYISLIIITSLMYFNKDKFINNLVIINSRAISIWFWIINKYNVNSKGKIL